MHHHSWILHRCSRFKLRSLCWYSWYFTNWVICLASILFKLYIYIQKTSGKHHDLLIWLISGHRIKCDCFPFCCFSWGGGVYSSRASNNSGAKKEAETKRWCPVGSGSSFLNCFSSTFYKSIVLWKDFPVEEKDCGCNPGKLSSPQSACVLCYNPPGMTVYLVEPANCVSPSAIWQTTARAKKKSSKLS